MSTLKEQYERDGYVIARKVLDRDLMKEARAHVSWLLQKHPELRPEQLHHWLAKDDPFWYRLIRDDRLLDIVEQFIGPDIALFATHYICKPPKTGQPVLWHQDGSYWPLRPMNVITLWLAVSESTPENGCMRVIPGTQHLQLQNMQERTDVESVLGSSIASEHVDESKAVDVVLEPGDVSIHHPSLVHGSEPNHSQKWRIGLTLRYIPTSTEILSPGSGCPFLLRGKAVEGVNSYLAPPVFDANRHFVYP